MNIEYNDEQVQTLKERLSFLTEVKHTCLAILIIFLLAVCGGLALIYFSMPLIGVLVSLVMAIPFVVAVVFFSYAKRLSDALRKNEYKIFRISYKSYEKMPGTHSWYKIVTSEGDVELFYYKEDFESAMPSELDVLMCKSNKNLMIAYDVI